MTTDDKTAEPSAPQTDEEYEAEAQKAWSEFEAADAKGDGADDEPAPEPEAASQDDPEPEPEPEPSPDDKGAKPSDADAPAAGGDDEGADKGTAADAAGPDDGKTAKSGKAASDDAASQDDGTPDIWADAPPELRSAHEADQKKLEQLTSAKTRAEGAMSGLQRKVNDLQRQLADFQAKPPANKSAGEGEGDGGEEGAPDGDAPKSPFSEKAAEKLAALKEEYPEIGDALGDILSDIAAANQSQVSDVKTQLSSLTEKQQQDFFDEQTNIVAEMHGDFTEALASPEFFAWYETAPDYKKAAVERNGQHFVNGHEVAALLNDFKHETGWASSAAPEPSTPANGGDTPPANGEDKPKPALSGKRRTQLESARSPRSRTPAAVTTGPPEDPEAAWEWFEKQGL